jgi:site-specific recombinase XerD
LHIANQKGISTPISFSEIKNKTFKGNRTFLEITEIQKLHNYWNTDFINETHKNMLSIFLFSCFTGLRFSDVTKLTAENIIENFVVFTAEKTGKFQRIPINKTAQKFIKPGPIFNEIYTNEYFNRELKNIAKICGIRKVLSFHVSRHTFATNFLVCGGRVEHLQKLLGHYKIEETMIYVHIVENLTNLQVFDMDKILK